MEEKSNPRIIFCVAPRITYGVTPRITYGAPHESLMVPPTNHLWCPPRITYYDFFNIRGGGLPSLGLFDTTSTELCLS